MTAVAVQRGTPPRHPSWHAGVPTVRTMTPLRWIRIDPNLHGQVTPRTLDALRSRGLAAHVHDAERRHRWILAVVPHGAGPAVPAFVARLDDHHRWLRRRGGAPLPAAAAHEAAAAAAFAAMPAWWPYWWAPERAS